MRTKNKRIMNFDKNGNFRAKITIFKLTPLEINSDREFRYDNI